jgi:hypothetical protein
VSFQNYLPSADQSLPRVKFIIGRRQTVLRLLQFAPRDGPIQTSSEMSVTRATHDQIAVTQNLLALRARPYRLPLPPVTNRGHIFAPRDCWTLFRLVAPWRCRFFRFSFLLDAHTWWNDVEFLRVPANAFLLPTDESNVVGASPPALNFLLIL